MRDLTGFNPRSREGNDVFSAEINSSMLPFQSTFPRGERRYISEDKMRDLTGFNPRSREGNDVDPGDGHAFWYKVSIHVPARGTTSADC